MEKEIRYFLLKRVVCMKIQIPPHSESINVFQRSEKQTVIQWRFEIFAISFLVQIKPLWLRVFPALVNERALTTMRNILNFRDYFSGSEAN